MFCKNCGSSIEVNATTCSSCGATIAANQSQNEILNSIKKEARNTVSMFTIRDIFLFDRMLVPKLITLLYWLGLLLSILFGLATMFGGFRTMGYYGGFANTGGRAIAGLFMGGCLIVFGAIGTRIWCELLIVIFKIYENTKKIAENQ